MNQLNGGAIHLKMTEGYGYLSIFTIIPCNISRTCILADFYGC